MDTKTIPFAVDLPGLIDLMGTALYSRPDAAVRELLQNAHDGIQRRRLRDISFQGRIRIEQDSETKTLTFIDDGIGLTPEEAEKYLGTLGSGITGMLRRNQETTTRSDCSQLIGMFGIGLLSSFLLADRIVLESRHIDLPEEQAIRWEAGTGTSITIGPGEKTDPGTSVKLYLRKEQVQFAFDEEMLVQVVCEYADFLSVPIFLNDNQQRINLIQPSWLEPESDEDAIGLALEATFHETPLCVIPIRIEKPVTIQGALYVTPQRLPQFSDDATVTATIRRMVISRQIQGLMPNWAPFIRGVLELTDCRPTASREELVRDSRFGQAKMTIENALFEYFNQMAIERPATWEAILTWHRYSLTGAAITNDFLRALLRKTYKFSTTAGKLTFDEILEKSPANPIFEQEIEYIIWFHGDHRQESAIATLFAGGTVPCVNACMTFEESLLIAMSYDAVSEGRLVECRPAVIGTQGFGEEVLGASETEPLEERWTDFFDAVDAKFFVASCSSQQPVFAFLNERRDLVRTLGALKDESVIPSAFQRMIDQHLDGQELPQNEVLLNRNHPLVARALAKATGAPLASVLRILVMQTLQSAGALPDRKVRECMEDDIQWVAEALWGKD